MDFLGRVLDWINRIFENLIYICMAALIVVVTVQITSRSLFTATSWSEEMSRFLLIYISLMGAACAFKNNKHISIRLFHDKLSPRAGRVFEIVVGVLCVVFFILMLRYGVNLILNQRYQVSGTMKVPIQYIYIAIPVTTGVMLLQGIQKLAKDVWTLIKGGEAR